jgi:outer membrane receptor protein involved in Fe transport
MSPILALMMGASPEAIASATPPPVLVIAQEAAPAVGSSATAPETAQGVTPYPAAFFAGAQLNTAADMIGRIPGFAFDGGDSVRGYGGAAGNVLIDGQRPATKSESLYDALRRIQASQVERIDLIRGGAPGIDMQGKTVIANVILKKGGKGTWLFAVAGGLHQDGRGQPATRFEGNAPIGPGTFDWSQLYFIGIDDGAGEGIQRGQVTGSAPVLTAWDETAGVHGADIKAGWKMPLLGGKLALNSRYYKEIYNWSLNQFDQPRSQRLLLIKDRQDREDGELGGSWETPIGQALKLELTALTTERNSAYTSAFDDGTDEGVYSEASLARESIGRAVLRYTLSPAVSFEGGAEAAFNTLEVATDYAQNGVPIVLPAADVLIEEERAEGFVTANWRISPKFAIETGLKVEGSKISQSGDTTLSKSFTYPKPRLIATWSPTAVDQVRVRIEREVGQLNFRDFASSVAFTTGGTVTAGGADLEPDKTTVFEAAYERKFWKDGAVTLKVTHEEITDATDRIRVTDIASCPIVGGAPDLSDLSCNFDAPGNIGEGTSDELELSASLPLGGLGVTGGLLKANLQWTRSEVTDPTTGDKRRISGQAPFEGEISFSQDLPKYRLQWGADAGLAFQERYYRFDRIDELELGTWVSLFAEWKPQPDLSFRVEAQNLLNRDLTRSRRLYDAPRDTGSVRYTENRPLDYPAFIYFRIRKTFG